MDEKKALVEELNRIVKEFPEDRKQYWLDHDKMFRVVQLKVADFKLFNSPTENKRFKSSIVFNEETFVYIGRKIRNPNLSIVKSSARN